MSKSFETQKQIVRKALLQGRTLSSWEAIQEWGVTRLASIIHRLRNEGVSIEDSWQKNEVTRWKTYRISQEETI